MPAGNIKIDCKGMLLAGIGKTGRRDAFPIETNTRHLARFDAQQEGMPSNASIEALVKIDRHAEDDERYGRAYDEQPPARENSGQHAQENPSKKYAYSRPTEAIALLIKYAQAPLQSLYLSLNGC